MQVHCIGLSQILQSVEKDIFNDVHVADAFYYEKRPEKAVGGHGIDMILLRALGFDY